MPTSVGMTGWGRLGAGLNADWAVTRMISAAQKGVLRLCYKGEFSHSLGGPPFTPLPRRPPQGVDGAPSRTMTVCDPRPSPRVGTIDLWPLPAEKPRHV